MNHFSPKSISFPLVTKLPASASRLGIVSETIDTKVNMKKHNARIAIPVNRTPLIQMAVAIKAQHDKLGKTSPLAVLDWEKNGLLIEEAWAADVKLTGLEKEVEKLSGRLNVLVESSLADFVRSCRDVLTGAFRGELRQMVDFGFQVDDSPRPKKATDASVKKAA